MAELADALDSGSSEGNFVEVQVLLSAPKPGALQNLKGFVTHPVFLLAQTDGMHRFLPCIW